MRRIQLLLADERNAYQQLLVEAARSAAGERGLGFLEPRFAAGSTMRQMGQCFEVLRADPRPDGVLMLLVAVDEMESAVSALAKGGLDCVILNRIPAYMERLNRQFPERLLASVAPDQTEIGRIQGRQSLRLLPDGGTVLLILGAHNTPSAVSREQGFREVVGHRLDVRAIEGKWQAERAEEALSDWLRFGSKRVREVDLIVSQSDSMALGARRALQRHESEGGAGGPAAIPIVGCDGLPDEGVEMVRREELTATVVMPASSPRAVEILDAFWQRGEVLGQELLVPTSLPPVQQLEPLRRRART